jgi:tRNA uridine 5-carboxymethylaminomethyl modification enzyme
MFTSRAEHRSLLRQDNADLRLTPLGYSIGLAGKERYDKAMRKQEHATRLIEFIKEECITPDEANEMLVSRETDSLTTKTKLHNLLLRPQVSMDDLIDVSDSLKSFLNDHCIAKDAAEEASISIKYHNYIEKEKEFAERLNRFEDIVLHDDFNYHALPSLSSEARQKLSSIKPRTIGQASRISGVSPADISVLLVYVGK